MTGYGYCGCYDLEKIDGELDGLWYRGCHDFKVSLNDAVSFLIRTTDGNCTLVEYPTISTRMEFSGNNSCRASS